MLGDTSKTPLGRTAIRRSGRQRVHDIALHNVIWHTRTSASPCEMDIATGLSVARIHPDTLTCLRPLPCLQQRAANLARQSIADASYNACPRPSCATPSTPLRQRHPSSVAGRRLGAVRLPAVPLAPLPPRCTPAGPTSCATAPNMLQHLQ